MHQVNPVLPMSSSSWRGWAALDPAQQARHLSGEVSSVLSAKVLFADRPQTQDEEVVNAATGAVGLLGAVVAAWWLTSAAMESSASWGPIALFSACLVFMHLASTLYHAAPPGKPAKWILHKADHAAILLLIAGTYTPFALGPMRGLGGIWIATIEWSLAALGIALLLFAPGIYRRMSLFFYLLMGWLGLLFYGPMVEGVGLSGLAWLGAGGLAYTLGVLFYAAKQVPFAHGIWHLFVIAGSALHVWAVWRYAIPLPG